MKNLIELKMGNFSVFVDVKPINNFLGYAGNAILNHQGIVALHNCYVDERLTMFISRKNKKGV